MTRVSAKDLDTGAILEFLAGAPLTDYGSVQWATWGSDWPHSVDHALQPELPWKVILAKMRNLVSKGYVAGCACGCRGDWRITDKGLEHLKVMRPDVPLPLPGSSWTEEAFEAVIEEGRARNKTALEASPFAQLVAKTYIDMIIGGKATVRVPFKELLPLWEDTKP